MDNLNSSGTKNSRHYLQRTLLNLFFLLMLAIIIIINISSYYQVAKLDAANRLVIHTYQMNQLNHNLLLNMLDIESLNRGYLITNNKFFIENLNEKINQLEPNLTKAIELSLTPSQQKKLYSLVPLFKEKTRLNKQMLLLKEQNKLQPQTTILLINQSQNLSKEIKTILLNIQEKESSLLAQRNENVIYNFHQVNLFIFSTSIVTLLIILISLIGFNRQLSRQLAAENKLYKSEALLAGILDGTTDFIAALDLNFRYIAFNQSYHDEFKRIFNKQLTIGMQLQDALTHLPDEQKKAVELWQRALNGEEFTVIRKFGDKPINQSSYEITFSSIRDQHGNLIGASHISRNIQERIEAERSAITANEKLKLAYQELKKHDEGVSLLNQMDTLLQTCVTINEALELISRYCRKLLPFAAGIIYLTHHSGNYLVAAKSWNDPKNNLQTFIPTQCLAIRQGKLYRVFNKSDNIYCEHYTPQTDLQCYFCVPLLAQNEHIGLLYIEIQKTDEQPEEQLSQTTDSYELLINNLAGLIALSIANIRLKNDLKTRSIRDPLTNLYNRTYLNESLEREISRAERSRIVLAIIMIDLDHFKNINDTFGHQAGDLMLQTIGEVLLREVRKSDIACRYGGEEFLLALYDTSLEDAISRADHIRKKISHTKFHFAAETTAITASLGIAIYPAHGQTMDELIKAADKALYQSKKNGRNKVTVYQKQQ